MIWCAAARLSSSPASRVAQLAEVEIAEGDDLGVRRIGQGSIVSLELT
jgi:hypothetical protein